jgi:predicted unusual protein kinase regulating ubiquinone biosynthesis (AarF/ABC1/UbiB family)
VLRKAARAVKLGVLGKDLARLRRQKAMGTKDAQLPIVERLARLHGLPQKIGQILSLNELDGQEPVFTRLVETSAEMPASEAFVEIERALGRPWRNCFARLSGEGIGASLAQVHRGALHSGTEVAVKVQYPAIAEALELDLKALGWLTAPVGGLRRGFDLAGYRREVGTMFREELDYRHEAEMLKRFHSLASGIQGLEIPAVIAEFSGQRILTMSWMDGESFSTARQWTPEERRQIAEILLRFFLTSCFSWRMLHADPHPGNYRFRRGPQGAVVGVLDFGCVKQLSGESAVALNALIEDTLAEKLRGDPQRAAARFAALGFQPLLLASMQHQLPELCEILFEPFLANRPFDMNAWRLGPRVETLLAGSRWNFRMAGPPALIFFMRAYQGLVQYLSALDAPVNWLAIYEQIVGPRRETPCYVSEKPVSVLAASRALRIRVSHKGRTKAELTFPAASAENLFDLIPPEIEPKLAARSIDVVQISRSLMERGFPPEELFCLQEGENSFRVWLE